MVKHGKKVPTVFARKLLKALEPFGSIPTFGYPNRRQKSERSSRRFEQIMDDD